MVQLLFICFFDFRWHESIILSDYKDKSKHTSLFQFFFLLFGGFIKPFKVHSLKIIWCRPENPA